MATWQKILIVLGLGGVATYALWRLWPRDDISTLPGEFNLPAEMPVTNPSEMGMPLAAASSRRALSACPANQVWQNGQCVPVE